LTTWAVEETEIGEDLPCTRCRVGPGLDTEKGLATRTQHLVGESVGSGKEVFDERERERTREGGGGGEKRERE